MNLTEMRLKLAALNTEVRTLLATDVAAAETKMDEVRELKKQITLMEELAAEEERALLEQKKKEPTAGEEKVSEMRSITKQLYNVEMTTEERAVIKTIDNGAVIPKQFIKDLILIQKGFGSIKDICQIVPVTKNEGTIPVVDLDQNEMAEIAEGADIVDGTLVTTDVAFKCTKVGLIQTLSSELIEDAEVEIEGLVRDNFANIATAKENAKIVKVIVDNSVAISGATGYEDVEKAIDAALPSVKDGLSTLTNVSGYCLLKNMKDKTGRSLDLITEVGGIEYFHSKPIRYVEDAMLPASAGKTVFYIGNYKEGVKYCDRKAVTVARSTEAGFTTDTVKVRILERFIPVKGSVRSLKKIEF